jgi:hypothetical protein
VWCVQVTTVHQGALCSSVERCMRRPQLCGQVCAAVVSWCVVLLQATTAAAREAAREAARDRLYGTRRIKYGDEEKDAVHA